MTPGPDLHVMLLVSLTTKPGMEGDFTKLPNTDALQTKHLQPVSPWYQKSTRDPPPLPPLLEEAFNKIYATVMNPAFWFTYQPNLPADLRQAISHAKLLPNSNIGIYSQDKSSRICFASLSKTNEKVEQVLADTTKYKKLPKDMALDYQPKIKSWYRRFKKSLSVVEDDITKFLLPEQVATPHLKVMIKTHKVGCPVRLTFSSIGSTTSNLSKLLDHAYLKPTVIR